MFKFYNNARKRPIPLVEYFFLIINLSQFDISCIYFCKGFTYYLNQGYYYLFAKKWQLMNMKCHAKSVCSKPSGIQLLVTVARPCIATNIFNWSKVDLTHLSATSANWPCLLYPMEILKSHNASLHTSLEIVTYGKASLRIDLNTQIVIF